jgi:hypothetical protein
MRDAGCAIPILADTRYQQYQPVCTAAAAVQPQSADPEPACELSGLSGPLWSLISNHRGPRVVRPSADAKRQEAPSNIPTPTNTNNTNTKDQVLKALFVDNGGSRFVVFLL